MDIFSLSFSVSAFLLFIGSGWAYLSARRKLDQLRPEFDLNKDRVGILQEEADRLQKELMEKQNLLAASQEKFMGIDRQFQETRIQLNEAQKLADERQRLSIQAQAEADKANELLKIERELLNEAQKKLEDIFKSSASTALEGNNKQFLELAKQFFKQQNEVAKGDLAQRQQAIEAMVKPFKENLTRYQEQLRELELARQKSYTSVEKELKKVTETSQHLSLETRALKDALKKPHIRGRWGEIQLKNCVELAGMSEYADVTFQDFNDTDDGRFIPDLTVKMPGGRLVIVDCKAPLDAFIAALEASTDEERATQTARHGRQVKDHIKRLSSKSYQSHLEGSADFTVMFLPNESFLYAALESEGDLVEYGLQRKILVATPPTFVGLLKVIRYGWNEEKMARNAKEISAAGQELHKRLVDFVESFESVGRHLEKAKVEYDKGFTRLNSRVLVQARRMESLGVKSKKELSEGLGYEPKMIPEVAEESVGELNE